MAINKPGLAPRKLEGEVDIRVESDRLPVEPTVNKEEPTVEPKEEVKVEENTQPQEQPQEEEAKAQEQPVTNRAQERIQTLANEKAAAEARAQNAEAMLQRLVNVQTQQPAKSQEELLASQYKTFNASLGYPEDPREYANFVENKAALRAQQVTQQNNAQQRQQQETAEFVSAYPNAVNDPIFLGAVAAQKSQALSQGGYLTFKQAADIVGKELDSRVSKKAVAQVAQNDQSKDEAYVETTRGASVNRAAGSTPDIENMTLAEKEAWLKKNDAW